MLGTCGGGENEAIKHEAGEGERMQAGQGFRPALVIAGQAAQASHPAKEHEAAIGLGVLDDFEVDAVSVS